MMLNAITSRGEENAPLVQKRGVLLDECPFRIHWELHMAWCLLHEHEAHTDLGFRWEPSLETKLPGPTLAHHKLAQLVPQPASASVSSTIWSRGIGFFEG